jgi:hypothetical protein
MVPAARSDVTSDRPKVGQWQTWVLASDHEIEVPMPPADTSDQTTAELAERPGLPQERSPMANTAVQDDHAAPSTQRGHDLALANMATTSWLLATVGDSGSPRHDGLYRAEGRNLETPS